MELKKYSSFSPSKRNHHFRGTQQFSGATGRQTLNNSHNTKKPLRDAFCPPKKKKRTLVYDIKGHMREFTAVLFELHER
jgi:hypothetical protein